MFGMFKNKEPNYSPKQVRNAKPVRNPLIEWSVQDGKTLLKVPRRKSGLLGFLGKWMKVPDIHEVELELVGTLVWELCDGNNTVSVISEALCRQYKMNRTEADVSLHAFLRMLSQRGYIAFMVKKNDK